MKKEEIVVPEDTANELLGRAMNGMAEVSKEKNVWLSQMRMAAILIDLYKDGYVAGYHQAHGEKILDNVKNEPE